MVTLGILCDGGYQAMSVKSGSEILADFNSFIVDRHLDISTLSWQISLLSSTLTGIICENKLFWSRLNELAKSKKIKYISNILRFAVAGIALYWAFKPQKEGPGISDTFNLLKGIAPVVIAAAVAFWLANQVIFVSRWKLLLRVQSIHIGFWPALRLHFLGIFYNNCLPSAVGGDLLRAWYVTTHTDKKLEAALSVFVDRFVGISGMILMATICYWLIPVEGQQDGQQLFLKFDLLDKLTKYWWVPALILLIMVVALGGLIMVSKTRALLVKAFNFLRNRGLALVGRVHKAMVVYYRHKIAMLLALVLTFICQGAIIIGMWLVGRDLGIQCPAKYYFVFFPVAWIIGALPISIGGLGIWEGVLILLFASVAVERDQAQALALVHRALWLFGSFPGVIIHLCGAHLPKDFSVDYQDGES